MTHLKILPRQVICPSLRFICCSDNVVPIGSIYLGALEGLSCFRVIFVRIDHRSTDVRNRRQLRDRPLHRRQKLLELPDSALPPLNVALGIFAQLNVTIPDWSIVIPLIQVRQCTLTKVAEL